MGSDEDDEFSDGNDDVEIVNHQFIQDAIQRRLDGLFICCFVSFFLS